jgi:hypothetical protein
VWPGQPFLEALPTVSPSKCQRSERRDEGREAHTSPFPQARPSASKPCTAQAEANCNMAGPATLVHPTIAHRVFVQASHRSLHPGPSAESTGAVTRGWHDSVPPKRSLKVRWGAGPGEVNNPSRPQPTMALRHSPTTQPEPFTGTNKPTDQEQSEQPRKRGQSIETTV